MIMKITKTPDKICFDEICPLLIIESGDIFCSYDDSSLCLLEKSIFFIFPVVYNS